MSATTRTAKFFRRYRRTWLSAFQLMKVGGALAWRTEVSRLRKPPFNMDVRWNGNPRKSQYRYQGRIA